VQMPSGKVWHAVDRTDGAWELGRRDRKVVCGARLARNVRKNQILAT